MKEFFKQIIIDKTIRIGFAGAFIFCLFSLVFIVISYRSLPPYIPIFNQLPWGEQRLGQTPTILIPLLLGILIVFFNLIITSIIYSKYPLVSRILSITSIVIAILVLLFSIKTIKLIT